MKPLDDLKHRLREVDDLHAATGLLRWDQMTYMPPGGAPARGRHTATLSRLAHQRLTDPALGRLLDQLERTTAALPTASDEASLVRVTRRRFERAARVPASLVAELDEHAAITHAAWIRAKPANDFAALCPLLERTVELSRRWAAHTPDCESPADPLIAIDDPGKTAASLRALFTNLRAALVALLRQVADRSSPDDTCLRQDAPPEAQIAFGRKVIESFGYDFRRGRLDLAPHPFTERLAAGDVRITTRIGGASLVEAFFILLHECGHALYAQGIRPELDGTPLAAPPSSGVDESQARLWENLVGRSRGFWEHFYPQLQRALPDQLATVHVDTFYRAINRVQPTTLRGQADELTYDLHVLLRFDLEVELLEGRLAVEDLADTWRERFETDFGCPVPDDRQGVLQDVHWFSGRIGGVFQGYTLGNIMSAQFFQAAVTAHPEIPDQIAAGNFRPLHTWLRQNLYQHGAKFTAPELLQRATGQDLALEPYLEYLRRKYLGSVGS